MMRVVSNKSQLIELLSAILGKEPGLSQDVNCWSILLQGCYLCRM